MMKTSIPEGRLARAGVAGKAAVKIGARQLGFKAKRPFLSKPRQSEAKDELEDKNAEELFRALTQLRGTALKVAQMMSMEVELLPERYRKELEKSFHQVPPLNRVLVRKAITEAFGKPPEQVFGSFDANAFAAASMGQVHHATLPDGKKVAVKIQYPGIHVAMDNDMKLVRQVIKTLSLHNTNVALQSLAEIEARLREEVDYRLEATSTQWFQENLNQLDVSVPEVFTDWSSDRVLTTAFVEGHHLDDWLASGPSQAIRNQVGQRLYDLLIHSTFKLRRLHADPNPGNYLFDNDGHITLIDFGCVRRMSADFVETLPKLMQAYFYDDLEALLAAYQAIGMSHGDESERVYRDALRPFGQWLAEPMKSDSYDFGKHNDYTQRGKEAIQRLTQLSEVEGLAEEFIFFDRTVYGLFKIFERMGATVRIRHHWIQ